MELELSGIVRAVGKNHSITHLSLSRLTGKRSYAPPLIQVCILSKFCTLKVLCKTMIFM